MSGRCVLPKFRKTNKRAGAQILGGENAPAFLCLCENSLQDSSAACSLSGTQHPFKKGTAMLKVPLVLSLAVSLCAAQTQTQAVPAKPPAENQAAVQQPKHALAGFGLEDGTS